MTAVRSYDAAKRTRRTQGWIAGSTSANAEILRDLMVLRNRSRDLVRNNAYAARAVSIWVAHLVGPGLMPQCQHANPTLGQQAEALWKSWSRAADVEGGGFDGALALAVRTMVEGGDALIRRVPVRPTGPGDLAMRVAVLEGDQLATIKDRAANPRIVGGVEVDPAGRKVGFHVLPGHPGDGTGLGAAAPIVVSAADATLLYLRQRPGQLRGVPWLTPVMLALRDFDEWREAALVKAKVEACFGIAITRPDGDTSPLAGSSTDINGNRVETLEPGMAVYLQQGEDVRSITPSTNSAFEPFALQMLYGIAVGIGITFDQLTGDLRQANYSSLRAGKIEFRRALEQLQLQTVIPHACDPVWAWFVEAAINTGQLPGEPADYPVNWIPPRNEPIDPTKDLEAEQIAVRSLFKPLSAVQREQGYDPADIYADMRQSLAAIDAAGLASDVDPRRAMGGAAAAQQPTDQVPA